MPFTRPAASQRTTVRGHSLHWLDWAARDGSDVPVLMLHPNRTNARVWDFVVEHSKLGCRFVAPDARGHGLSDYPEHGYAYADYLGDIVELLDQLGIASAHLVGAATGGNLALLLASRHPRLAASLTVIDPGLSLDPELSRRVREQMVREFRFSTIEEARARMPFSDRWSEAMKDHYSAHSLRPLDGGGVEWRYHPAGVVETEHLLETPIWDAINVSCPTLIVRGAHSAVFPRANMDRLAAIIAGALCMEIDAGHRVGQDNPGALAAALDEFLGAQARR